MSDRNTYQKISTILIWEKKSKLNVSPRRPIPTHLRCTVLGTFHADPLLALVALALPHMGLLIFPYLVPLDSSELDGRGHWKAGIWRYACTKSNASNTRLQIDERAFLDGTYHGGTACGNWNAELISSVCR